MYNIVYDTGTSLAVQVLAFDNVNLKTWSRYLERLHEEFIERSGTWVEMDVKFIQANTQPPVYL